MDRRELLYSRIFLGETVTSISTYTLDPIIQGGIKLEQVTGIDSRHEFESLMVCHQLTSSENA
jgi:hypothetical protein